MSQAQEQEVRAIAADTSKRECHQARAILRAAYGENDREIIISRFGQRIYQIPESILSPFS